VVRRGWLRTHRALYVNIGRSEGWSVATYVSEYYVALPVGRWSVELLERVREAVLRLPSRETVPYDISEVYVPDIFVITFVESRSREHVYIVDIVGLRRDLTPTPWGYREGWWHPQVQQWVAESIGRGIEELGSSAEGGPALEA